MAEPVGDLPLLPPAEPVPGPAAEPVVEANQVFFCIFRLVVCVLVCFVK